MESEASTSKGANEQSITSRTDRDSVVAEGSSMEHSPVHSNNNDDDDKQSDMDTREHEEEDEEVEMEHPAMPPPFMPPRRHVRQPPPQHVRHIRFRE